MNEAWALGVVMVLIQFLLGVWSKRTLQNNKSMIDQLILDQNQKLEKLKLRVLRNNGISSDQLKLLFKEKISIYKELVNIKNQYTKATREDLDFHLEGEDYYPFFKLFKELQTIIEANRIVIGEELSRSYDLLYEKVISFIPQKEYVKYENAHNDDNSYEFSEFMWNELGKVDKKMALSGKSEMMSVLKIIEADFKKFRLLLDNAIKDELVP